MMMELPPVVDVGSVRRLIEEGRRVKLLDVRTPAEFESAHIRGAYNVPLDRLGEHREELRRHVADPVVLVCRSGQRARRAEQALREIGMRNLHVLDGGMNAWEAAGHAVERGRERLSLERQVRIAAGALAATGGVLALLVNPLFALVPTFVGSGLVFAGLTNTCAMAMVLSRLPYNRTAACDVDAVVAALRNGQAAPAASELVGTGRGGRRVATSCCG